MSDFAPKEAGIAARLFREGYQFDFFQSVRLLEIFLPGGKSTGETSDLNEERIRFRPHHGLAFPATDVRSIERLSGIPERGWLIDSPGLREIQLWAEMSGLTSAFPEIDCLARECHFRDWRHSCASYDRRLPGEVARSALAREGHRRLQEQAF